MRRFLFVIGAQLLQTYIDNINRLIAIEVLGTLLLALMLTGVL